MENRLSKTQQELNAQEKEFWDNKAREHSGTNQCHPLHYSEYIVSAINNFMAGNIHNVLEIGCNTGYLCNNFVDKGLDYTGVDISGESIRIARNTIGENDKCRFIVSTVENLPFENKSFDLVFSRDTLHHTHFSQALDEIKRVVKDNGTIVLIETSITNPIVRFGRDKIIGKFGSQACKNDTEYPLTKKEINMINNAFSNVAVLGCDFFRLGLRIPLFCNNRFATNLFNSIDNILFFKMKCFSFLSYEKIFLIRK